MFYSFKVCIAVIVAVLVVPCVFGEEKKLNTTKLLDSAYFSSKDSDSKQLIACNSHSECENSCSCYASESGANTCVDLDVLNSEFGKCACTSDSQCSDYCTFDGYCNQCGTNALQTAINACRPDDNGNTGNGNTGNGNTGNGNTGNGNTGNGNNSNGNNGGPCVETEWLRTNGFGEGILRKSGVAKTLCMAGLPCGTEGHLLRVCDVHGACALRSYKQVCEKRGDCEVKYTEVSRLSAKVDWSVVKLDECMDDGSTASLTSLSVDENDGDFGLSWGIAKIGEKLIGAGLGGAVDVLVLTWEDIGNHCDEVLRMMATAVGK